MCMCVCLYIYVCIYIYTHHIFFIHSSVDGHLDCFHVLAIVNSAVYEHGKGVRQGCILSPCLFNLYAEYIMRNAGLGESPAGIKIAWRNINNLRYADDTTLMAEGEEKLNRFLMRVKEESQKAGLNSTFKKRRSWYLLPSLHGK